jgi:hypothetical protein
MGKIASKKTEVDGHLFDSQTEAEFYQYLKSRDDVEHIQLQPQYIFLFPFEIKCSRCDIGKVPSPKTGKPIKCKACNGTGQRARQGWTYTADFQVRFKNGAYLVYDVKGWANERFPLVRKMFEKTQGYELLVVKKTKGGWKYV